MLSGLGFGQAARAGIPTLVVPTRHAQLRCWVAQRDLALRLLLKPDGAVSKASETLVVRRSRLRSSTLGELGRSVFFAMARLQGILRKSFQTFEIRENRFDNCRHI